MADTTAAELAAEIQKGRNLMGQNNFEGAATLLSANLEKWCAKYGEMASECAEAYMRYGIALTRECEEAEEKSGGADVFGATVPKEVPTGAAPEEAAKEGKGEAKKEGEGAEMMEEGEEEEGEEEGEGEGEEGGEEGEAPQMMEEGEEGEGEGEEGGEEGGDEEGKEEEEGSADGDDKGKGPIKEKSNEMSDDPLELAWTVLDVARLIFERDDTKELMKEKERERTLMLADTYCYMGDIGLRNEKFEQCISDYKRCFELREEVCTKDDRLLLEVHHQLAMAYSFHDVPNKPAALDAYRNAVAVCELRVKNLKAMIEMGDEAKEIEGSSVKPRSRGDMEQELNDIEMILVDLQEKLESELIDADLEPNGVSLAAGGAAANPFGGDAIAAMAAQAGFGTAPQEAAPVKSLGVFGKKAKANAQADAAKSAGSAAVGEKRPAEDISGDAAGDAKKACTKATVENTSAAPTPAKENEQAPGVTA